jgi:Kef-type K+ transport system membrane component KefB
MPRRRHESFGDYISSACFGGVAFMALLNGLEAFYAGQILRALSIWFVCLLLVLAVFRYAIARLFDSLKKSKNGRKNDNM